MSKQLVCYLVENHYGNFVPTSAWLIYTEGSADATLFPQADSMPHVELKDAQRFLLKHSPPDSLIFVNPVQPSLTLTLNDLHAANQEPK